MNAAPVVCPNCGRAVYAPGMAPGARRWCECDTFAEVDRPAELTESNTTAPLALF